MSLPAPNKMDVESNIKLSPYSDEVHGVVGKFYGCHNYTEIEYLGKYRTSVGKLVYGSNGNVSKRCYRRINLGWESFFFSDIFHESERHPRGCRFNPRPE